MLNGTGRCRAPGYGAGGPNLSQLAPTCQGGPARWPRSPSNPDDRRLTAPGNGVRMTRQPTEGWARSLRPSRVLGRPVGSAGRGPRGLRHGPPRARPGLELAVDVDGVDALVE